jgi:hypothetical protein
LLEEQRRVHHHLGLPRQPRHQQLRDAAGASVSAAAAAAAAAVVR